MESENNNKPRFTIEPRITLDGIVQAAVIIVGLTGVYWKQDARSTLIEEKQSAMEKRFEVHLQEQRQDTQEFKSDLKEVQRSLNSLTLAVTQRK